MAKKTIVRKNRSGEGGNRPISVLSDSEKYQVLQQYKAGVSTLDIANSFDIYQRDLSIFITSELKALNTILETNKLLVKTTFKTPIAPKSTELTDKFLDDVKDNWEVYAYFYGVSNDNAYALKMAGFTDTIIANPIAQKPQYQYALRVRGQYLRSIPEVAARIAEVRREELKLAEVDKPYVVTEILTQIEELKLIIPDNPSERRNLITLIRMLGETVSAFTTNIKVTEINPEDSLNALIEMAQEANIKELD